MSGFTVAMKKINMSTQSCNYCKEKGHRIHAMDEYGVYLADANGERILSCPIIIAKNSAKVEMEFPPLSGSAAPASEWTVGLSRAITTSLKEKKQKEWMNRKAEKEAKRRDWEERHVDRMKVKYGPLWHWQVKGTHEDVSLAINLRDEEEEEKRIREEEEYYKQQEREEQWQKEWEQESKETEERRAKMTPEERRQDEWDEEEEMDNDLWRMSCDNEMRNCFQRELMTEEKIMYEKNGWPWPPKRF
jgi:hypothetical protein